MSTDALTAASNALSQFQRLVKFDRLLSGHPFTRPYIVQESNIDIPPFVRSDRHVAGVGCWRRPTLSKTRDARSLVS